MTDLQTTILLRRLRCPAETYQATADYVDCSVGSVRGLVERFNLKRPRAGEPTAGRPRGASSRAASRARLLFRTNPYASQKTVMKKLGVSAEAADRLIQMLRPNESV